MTNDLVEIEGTVAKIIYSNKRNGYRIADLKVYGIDEFIRIKGYNIPPPIREVIRFKAREANNPKYPILQYEVFGYVVIVPATTSDISEYLGSGVIKGLGPETAREIVNKFGLQTINIIKNDIDRLKEVEGVGPKTIEAIKKGYPG
jgi:exodeoxyribonuclease V alpha subunit